MVSTEKPAAGANGKRATDGSRGIVCQESPTCKIALDWLRSGVSIIPLRLDGSKASAIPWKQYQREYATDSEVRDWFQHNYAIGVVCGEISGGLEVLDFDDGNYFNYWLLQTANIACKLPIIETPNDGYHVIYRCDAIGHNRKIATDPRAKKQTLIETRGEGGYIAGCGSPFGVHEKKNRTYVQIMGPELPEIPRITREERRELFRVARTFDKAPPKPKQTQPSRSYRKCDSIEQYNRNPNWATVLPGWTTTNGTHWTRPGKKFGCSAKLCIAKDGTPLITIYTSNANMKPQSYNAFELLVKNCFRGDRRAALQAIKEGQR